MSSASLPDLENTQPFVKFGDHLTFYLEDRKGYMYGDNPVTGNLVVRPAPVNNPAMPDVKAAVFQIHPQYNYKFSSRLRKIRSKYQKNRIPEDDEVRNLAKLAATEATDNELEFARQLGKIVRYGQEIHLKHVVSNKFISASANVPAQLDIMNMEVYLDSDVSKNCYFKLMPRFKVRAEGDLVRYRDQVTFESVKLIGRYLNCGPNKFDSGVHEGEFELDVSNHLTTFSIFPHYNFNAKDVHFLKGGDVICILHKELDSYLTAEGIFTDPSLTEEPHLRQRQKGATLEGTLVSLNSTSYWQIEFEDDSLSGEPLFWERQILLKHLTTRKYLCIQGGKFTLTPKKDTKTAVFRFRPVVKTGMYTEVGASVTLEHPLSSKYLHADSGDFYEYAQNLVKEDEKDPMLSLHWESAISRKCLIADAVRFDDAVVLLRVEQKNLKDFYYTAGLSPIIHHYTTVLGNESVATLDDKVFAPMETALSRCKDFLQDTSSRKRKQDLLRYLKVIDGLVKVLQLPFKQPAQFQTVKGFNPKGIDIETLPKFPRLRNICLLTYEILALYLSDGSKKNAMYTARYMSFFLTQIGYDIKTAAMLRFLVKDTLPIVDRIRDVHINFFVTWLTKQKNPYFLDFLKVLCVCEDKAMTRNQGFILDNLSYANETHEIFLDTRLENGKIQVQPFGSKNYLDIVDFCKTSDASMVSFLESQLALFAAVCSGRNDRNIDIVRKIYPLDFILAGLEDPTLASQPKVKISLTLLLDALYIDVGQNRPVLRRVQMGHIWDEIQDLDSEKISIDRSLSLSGERLPFVPHLKDWIAKFLAEETILVCTEKNSFHHHYIESVLKIVLRLITFGYFSTREDISQLLDPLYDLMDGKTDTAKDLSKTMKVDQEESRKWLDVDRFNKSSANLPIFNIKLVGLQVLDALINLRILTILKQFLFDFKGLISSENLAKHNRPMLFGYGGATAGRTNVHMLELASYLRTTTLPPLHLVHTYVETLRNRTNYLDQGGKLVDVCLDLARYHDKRLSGFAIQIVNRHYTQIAQLFERGQNSVVMVSEKSVADYKGIIATLQDLKRLNSLEMDGSLILKVQENLQNLVDYLRLADDHSEPNIANQRTLNSCRTLSDILDILRKPVNSSLEHRDGLTKIRALCLSVLKHYCRRDKETQARIFENMDELLTLEGVERELADCLTEVFIGNEELALKVSEEQIKTLVMLLGKLPVMEILRTLNGIARVGYYPLKRNQNLIVKHLMQNRKRTLLLVDTKDKDKRMELMRQASRRLFRVKDPSIPDCDEDTFVKGYYHQFLVRTLATCAEGENKYIQSMCQNIFSVEDLLDVASDPLIHRDWKRPYLRFLLWAYMTAGHQGRHPMLVEFCYNPRAWDLLCDVETLLREISAKDLTTLHLTNPTDRIYAFEAAVSCFKEFFDLYYEDTPRMNQECPKHIKIRESILDTLVDFYGKCRAAPEFAERRDRQKINTVIRLFIAKGYATEKAIGEYGVARKIDIPKHDLGHKAEKKVVREYMDSVRKEFEIHDTKQSFVGRMREAYEADPLTPGYPSTLRLPRGEEFQRHLASLTARNSNGVAQITSIHLQSLLHALDNSLVITPKLGEYERSLQVDIDIKTLNLIRATMQNELIKMEKHDRLSKEYHKCLVDFRATQSYLNRSGVTKQAVRMVNSIDDRVVDAALRLLVTLLNEGHHEVQNSFLEYVQETQNERFFEEIRERLQVSTANIRESRALRTMKETQRKQEANLLSSARGSSKNASAKKNSINQPHSAPPALRHGDGDSSEIALKRMTSNLDADALELDADDEEEEELLTFTQVVGLILPIMRTLQLLCENHNAPMRDYLRYQPDNFQSINLVKEVVTYLSVLAQVIDDESIELVTQVVDTLNEFSMGNVENQRLLFDSNVLNIVNQIIRQPKTSFLKENNGKKLKKKEKNSHAIERDEIVGDLISKTVSLVRTMLDDDDAQTTHMAKQVISVLDLEAIFETAYYFGHYIKKHESLGELAFECSAVLARINDLIELDPNLTEKEVAYFARYKELSMFSHEESKTEALISKYEKKPGFNKKDLEEFHETIEERLKSVEIVMDDKLERVYFRSPATHLTKKMKNEFLFQVNRDTPLDKVRDFMERSRSLRIKMDLLRRLNKNPFSRMIIDNHTNIFWSTMLMTLVINILMLVAWQAPNNFTQILPFISEDMAWFYTTLKVLGAIHCFFSFLTVLEHFLTDPPFQHGDRIRNLTNELTGGLAEEILESLNEEVNPEMQKHLVEVLTSRSEGDEKRKKRKLATVSKVPISERIVRSIVALFRIVRITHIYYIVFLPLAILGIFSEGYTFGFHLLHIVVGNDILIRVLQSVTKNGKSLLWVALLGLIVIYLYSLLIFAFYRAEFSHDPGLICETMWQCFITSLNLGLRNGGGIAESMQTTSDSWNYLGVRALFDLSFFIIVIVIGLNIVFGIIVDTFSELRDEKKMIEEDMQSNCFICSIESSDFDRNGNGFEHHLKYDHNIWNYLFFLIHLEEKDPFEYTAQESYVFRKIQNEDVSWFPIHRAMCLTIESTGVEERLDHITHMLSNLMNRFKESDIKKMEENQQLSYKKWKAEAALSAE